MALDHALAASLEAGRGVLRLYGWRRPTVSFGKNEPARRLPDDPADVDYVRRPTGGRAVLHDAELTYAVVAPLDAFGGLRPAYVQINRVLAGALASLGATVQVAGDVDALGSGVDAAAHVGGHASPLPLDAGPCFQSPTRGEIVAAGRKLVGSAQARLEGALLQHGSILLREGRGQLGSECVTLTELVGEVDDDEVAGAVRDALMASLGGRWTERPYQTAELEAADRLEEERYGRDEWTWRQ